MRIKMETVQLEPLLQGSLRYLLQVNFWKRKWSVLISQNISRDLPPESSLGSTVNPLGVLQAPPDPKLNCRAVLQLKYKTENSIFC